MITILLEYRIWLTYVFTSNRRHDNMSFILGGRNDYKKAEYLISGTKFEHFPKLNYPEFVFIGRSNVGKSSLLNAITNRKNLAYTSSKPGKTITLNFYNVNDEILLVDVPGYGYAEKVKYDRLAYGKMIENYLNYSKNLISCF